MEDPAGLVPWVMDNLPLLITAVFIPLLVGLATRLDAKPVLKSAVNIAISFLAALVDAIMSNDGEFDWKLLLVAWAVVTGVSHNAYKIIWKPLGDGQGDPVRVATPNTGLGSGPPVA